MSDGLGCDALELLMQCESEQLAWGECMDSLEAACQSFRTEDAVRGVVRRFCASRSAQVAGALGGLLAQRAGEAHWTDVEIVFEFMASVKLQREPVVVDSILGVLQHHERFERIWDGWRVPPGLGSFLLDALEFDVRRMLSGWRDPIACMATLADSGLLQATFSPAQARTVLRRLDESETLPGVEAPAEHEQEWIDGCRRTLTGLHGL